MYKDSQLTKSTYKLKEISNMLGVTTTTLKNWERANKLEFERTPTNIRYLSRQSLIEVLDNHKLYVNDTDAVRRDVIYARVSSHDQKKHGDLDRQVQFLIDQNDDLQTVGYRVEVEKKEADYERVAFVDPGLNNLMTVTSTEFEPIIYNGRPLKSINQYYNKQKALEVSRLETRHGQKTSHQTRTLDRKRKHKIKDYCHKVTTDLVNQLVSHGVQTLVFGHNTGQKQDINLGKRTNQNFVNIPFTLLIHMLEYKCRVNGIHFIVHEESHTSKCSFIDQESIEYHEDYLGRRIKRGLFESLLGKKYNSDVNGSLNIGRKYLTTINKYTIEIRNKLLSMMGNPRVRTV